MTRYVFFLSQQGQWLAFRIVVELLLYDSDINDDASKLMSDSVKPLSNNEADIDRGRSLVNHTPDV